MGTVTTHVYAFRAGNFEGVWSSKTKAQLQDIFSSTETGAAFLCCGIADSAKSFVCTELLFPARNETLSGRYVRHTLAQREKLEPDVVFVGWLSHEEYRAARADAHQRWLNRRAEEKETAERLRTLLAGTITWGELPAELQSRLRGNDVPIDICWLPKRMAKKHPVTGKREPAPYRRFYIALKGSIPSNLVLRHKCDNRQCMNPNHLEPGTHQENVDDKMARGRQFEQRYRATRKEWERQNAIKRTARSRKADNS